MPRLLTVLALVSVAWPSLSAQIPSPEQQLGFPVGTDRRLADWAQIVDYYETLDRESGRISVQNLGPSTEGRPFLLAVISLPQTLEKLEEYPAIQQKLADPRLLEGSPEALFASGKTVVLVTCAIHSTEVASAQMSMEFAYDMASADDPETLEILSNVIFLLVPSLNPDGIDFVNHWYAKTVGTPAEGLRPPGLYHKYVGHDNNRDWYMFTQRETRIAVEQIHNRWRPQIVYDIHQMGSRGARIFVPPFIDPVDPNVDPILQAGIVDLGGAMFSALIGAGREGVVTNAIYDAYTPARAYQHYHAGVRILSESASVRLASPITVSPQQLGQGRNYHASKASWNFPRPWRGGEWRLRDIVDDQKIALKALLLHAARYRRHWLRNFHRVGLNTLNRVSPNAFVIPPLDRQPDPAATLDLLEVLHFGDVELKTASTEFAAGAIACVSAPRCRPRPETFPEGSFLIAMEQPYSSFAKTMLEVQEYPELREYPGGPLKRPYDVTAQTLGIQMGVETYQIDGDLTVQSELLAAPPRPAGRVEGEGKYWLFSHTNNAFAPLANRFLAEGLPVYWAPNGFRVEGESFPVGTLMARGNDAAASKLDELVADLPVVVWRFSKWPQLAWQRIRAPAIGLYKSSAGAMDEGWTRWILEQHDFPYESLTAGRIRAGTLSDLDVIVFAHESPRQIKEGLGEPYPDEFRGGIGGEGLVELEKFARAGGMLLFLGDSVDLALSSWDLKASNAIQGLSPQDFYIPGSFLRVKVHDRHPIGYGMGPEASVMFLRGAAFDVERGINVARYDGEPLLLSGWADGLERLRGKSALAEIPLGKGSVVLIGFRTQFRAQARATYKFLFNSLYYSTISR